MRSGISESLVRRAPRSAGDLRTLLIDSMDWPLPDDFDELPLVDWSPEELHLNPEQLGKLTSIQQVPRLTSRQPFGIFVLNFDGGRLPIGALRRLVGQLVRKKRARATIATHGQWNLDELIFFCHNNANGDGSLHIVAFRDTDGKPDIKVISWTTGSTDTRIRLITDKALPDLAWPDRNISLEDWRQQWSEAFTVGYRQGVKTAAALSQRMADVARDIRTELTDLLAVEAESGPVHVLLREVRDSLDTGITPERFADMFAQTLVYGLLSARVTDPPSFDEADSRALIDFENPFLDAIYARFHDQADDSLDLDHLGLADLAHTLANTDIDQVLADFGAADRKDDPVVFLYEDFLTRYDPEQRRKLGAYYTPVPVVRTIVTLVDDLLINDLGLAQGIADPTTWEKWAQLHPSLGVPAGVNAGDAVISMVDPATGTGTFLLEWIRHLRDHHQADLGRVLHHAAALELSLASYSVAHLKTGLELPATLRARTPLPIYLTDTLAGRAPQHIHGTEDPIAAEAERAEQIRFDEHQTIVIGNPPYERVEKDDGGGWITHPGQNEKSLFSDILDPARANTIFSHHASLYNKYVYFWRWAIWKAFEQTEHGPAIVSLITASSWLTGPGFLGLRQLAREVADNIWIIDLGGDNKGARTEENIFGIETPVAIVTLARTTTSNRTTPAVVHYTRIGGTSAQKLAELDTFTRQGTQWQPAQTGWHAPLIPLTGGSDWTNYPQLIDLIPWQQPGCMFNRTWPIAPDPATLERRWARLVQNEDPDDRANCFYTAKTGRNIHTKVAGLPRLVDEPKGAGHPPIVAYGFRSFDQQYAFHDPRVAALERPSLWASRSDRQIFMVTTPTGALSNGPGAFVFTAVPDKHAFNGRGGKDVLPLYRDRRGTPNSDPVVLGIITSRLRESDPRMEAVTPEDVFAYCYAVLAGTDYTTRFADELATPGPRVPLTSDPELFHQVVEHGRHLVWLHTHGQRFSGGRADNVRIPQEIHWTPAPTRIPANNKDYAYHPEAHSLTVADGHLQGVRPEVWDFQVSGMPVVAKWLGYRTAKGTGRAASSSNPLDHIRPTSWRDAWTSELAQLVHILSQTLILSSVGAALLDRVVVSDLITSTELPEPPKHLRAAPVTESNADTNGQLSL